MIEVTLIASTTEDGSQGNELETIQLPGVPRAGDQVITQGAVFTVQRVIWSEELIQVYMLSEKYGIHFPVPRQN